MTRDKTQKVLLTEDEEARLLELSAAMRRQRGPLIRDLIDAAYLDYQSAKASPCTQKHPIVSRVNREGPRHGHIASRRRVSLPSRGGAPDPHLRV